MHRVPRAWETEMKGSLEPGSSGPSDSVVRSPSQKQVINNVSELAKNCCCCCRRRRVCSYKGFLVIYLPA